MLTKTRLLFYLTILCVGNSVFAKKDNCSLILSENSAAESKAVQYTKLNYAWSFTDMPDEYKITVSGLIRKANEIYSPYFPQPLEVEIEYTASEDVENSCDSNQGPHTITLTSKGITYQFVTLHEFGHALFDERLKAEIYLLAMAKRLKGKSFYEKKWWDNKIEEQGRKLHKIALPYNEIFADLTAALYIGCGNCHLKFFEPTVTIPEEYAEIINRSIRLLDMTIDHSIEEIEAIDLFEKKHLNGSDKNVVDPHILLAKSRSHIWKNYSKNKELFKNPAEFLNLVFKILKKEILKEFAWNIMNSDIKKRSVEKANSSLIKSFDKAFNSYLTSIKQ